MEHRRVVLQRGDRSEQGDVIHPRPVTGERRGAHLQPPSGPELWRLALARRALLHSLRVLPCSAVPRRETRERDQGERLERETRERD
ncbi:hypothetical protein WMY93_002827 [Mugilogobius chulae]|uniref:Uncharacterized protein n=1 Tax=Mugilogobius chulae TaxID=88201 RepID=A0AAW0QA31_9GOBI